MTDETAGILLMIAAVFCFGVMDVTAKWLTERHPPLQVVWARYVSQAAWACLLMAPWLLRYLRTTSPGLQATRSVFQFFATMCFFTAISKMPLAEAVAIFEVAPLIITAMAFFILREQVGTRRWAGVAIGFAGAMIIIRPEFEAFDWWSLAPLGAAFFYAGYAVATRWLGEGESPWTSFLYTGLFGAVAASLIAPFVWVPPTLPDAAIMATFGILGGIGHLCLILSLRRASASVLAPFGYVGLIFGAVFGWSFFGEAPDAWTWLGAAVIVGAGLYVWHRERTRAAAT